MHFVSSDTKPARIAVLCGLTSWKLDVTMSDIVMYLQVFVEMTLELMTIFDQNCNNYFCLTSVFVGVNLR